MTASTDPTYLERLARHKQLVGADEPVRPLPEDPPADQTPFSEIRLAAVIEAFEEEMPFIRKRLRKLAKGGFLKWNFALKRIRHMEAALERLHQLRDSRQRRPTT